jgi:cytochrome c oxidase subunit 2
VKPGQHRLLEVDNRVVLPVDTTIRLVMTGDDVIHAWAAPAFGNKEDTVPGRLHESWVRIEREGVYYGQCSELCGTGHAYMPIAVEAVSKERFARWAEEARVRFATPDRPSPVDWAMR